MTSFTLKEAKCKLQGDSGDTLVEVLVALLVSSLAMALLVMAVSVSSNVISQSRDSMSGVYEAGRQIAEKRGANIDQAEATVTITGTIGSEPVDSADKTLSVTVCAYEDEGITLKSYDYKAPGTNDGGGE